MPAKEAPKTQQPAAKQTQAAPAKKSSEKKKAKKTVNLTHNLAVGLKKGHKIQKRELKKAPYVKGHASKRTLLIREVIREVTGFSPYEKRIMELLRNDLEKRALKLAKKKLGGHSRAKRKWNELQEAIRKIREAKQQ